MASESDFMSGGCYALALWLHRRCSLPLYGLYDAESVLHHAFIQDTKSGTFYDARGEHNSIKSIRHYRGIASRGTVIRSVSLAVVQEYARDVVEIARIMGRKPPPSIRTIAHFVRSHSRLARLVQDQDVVAPIQHILD
jgi:hypothetical protein